MANEEQLSILKQEVGIWNKWMKKNSDPKIELKEANLYDADLDKFDLSNADLGKASLENAKLYEANLAQANLAGASRELHSHPCWGGVCGKHENIYQHACR